MEPITLYFAANPNDGLVETHNVDKTPGIIIRVRDYCWWEGVILLSFPLSEPENTTDWGAEDERGG